MAAERVAHRLTFEVERLRAKGVAGQAAIARALTERGVPTPRGRPVWTHTTVARVLARAEAGPTSRSPTRGGKKLLSTPPCLFLNQRPRPCRMRRQHALHERGHEIPLRWRYAQCLGLEEAKMHREGRQGVVWHDRSLERTGNVLVPLIAGGPPLSPISTDGLRGRGVRVVLCHPASYSVPALPSRARFGS